MMHARFSDANWYNPDTTNVVLGGAGGIGSWLALFLNRIGYNIYLYEMDTIEEHNIGGQLYGVKHIGTTKSDAVSDICGEFCDYSRIHPLGEFKENSQVFPIAFSAFDNMRARRFMFDAWKKGLASKPDDADYWFIDGRMTAETGIIYCVNKDNIDRYEEEFFDDSEVEEQQCSYKATSHNGAMLASIMTSNFLNIMANKKLGADIFRHPFKVMYELPSLTLNSVS